MRTAGCSIDALFRQGSKSMLLFARGAGLARLIERAFSGDSSAMTGLVIVGFGIGIAFLFRVMRNRD
jgi:hypothetical protein